MILFKVLPFTALSSTLFKEKKDRIIAVIAVNRMDVGQRSRYFQ